MVKSKVLIFLIKRNSLNLEMYSQKGKSHLKHSTAEFQSIQQFLLQLYIVSEQKKENLKCWRTGLRRRMQKPETS